MALTIARNAAHREVSGAQVKTWGTLDFDSSYAVGGESLTARDLGLYRLDRFSAEAKFGFAFEYDYTNTKLLVYTAALGPAVLTVNLTAVGNVTTGEDDLMSYSLPASTLSANGMGVRVTSWGITANNANTKTVKMYFGTAVMTQALTASIAGSWHIQGVSFRTGAATQDNSYALNQGATDIAHAEFVATTVDETAAIAIKCTGESSSATDDIIQEGQLVELIVPGGTGAVGAQVVNAQSLAGLTGVRWMAVGA